MSKKLPAPEPKKESAPTFRPLEDKLKALAAKAKAEEAEKKKAQTAAPAKKQPTPPTAPSPRASTLTRDEQRELAAMQKEQGRDDEFFFARLMSGVVPLGDDKKGRITTAKVEKKPKQVATANSGPDPDEMVRDQLMNLVEGATRFEVSDDGKRLEGRRLDLGDATYRRLRRGELPIDARLDLHGLTSEQARAALEKFLEEKRARKDRNVLVIHGRGEHSPAGVGVLRGEIAAWLSQGRASRHVAAFATAHKDDGGEGALYVLLRV